MFATKFNSRNHLSLFYKVLHCTKGNFWWFGRSGIEDFSISKGSLWCSGTSFSAVWLKYLKACKVSSEREGEVTMAKGGRLNWISSMSDPLWPFFCKSQLVKWWWCHNRQRGRWCVSKHCSKMLFFVFVMLNDCVDIDGDSPSTSNWKL